MIGIEAVRSSSRSSSATRQPSSPGIITSRRITSGSLFPRDLDAAEPVRRLEHLHPLRLEVHAAEQTDRRLIVDHEHPRAHLGASCPFAEKSLIAGDRQLEGEA